jgi:hypothetical protein
MKITYRLEIGSAAVSKLQAIILIRSVTGMGLKEAKEIADWGGRIELAGNRELEDLWMASAMERAKRAADQLRRDGSDVMVAISGPASPSPFNRDRFFAFRNAAAADAEAGVFTERRFSSGQVSITAMNHADGGISWTCRFDGGREFRGITLFALELLLEQAGEI